jgi:hypothetical protein
VLATLETGIEGGKWFRLIDKVWSPKNLAGSLQKVVAKGGSAGIDNQSARAVCEHREQTIQKLELLPKPSPSFSVSEKLARYGSSALTGVERLPDRRCRCR